MPLIDVTFDETIDRSTLRQLGDRLPDVVAVAVDCPDEPWVGPARAGDVEIRFHQKSDLDVGALNVVVEVRTKLFDSRLVDVQRRAALIRGQLSDLSLGLVGVWLILAEGAWSQG